MNSTTTILGGDIILTSQYQGGGGVSESLYRGRQLSTGMECVVKTTAGANWSQAVLHESRVLARVASDHVPRLLQIGYPDADGVQWFATEFVDGDLLQQVVQDCRLDATAAVGVLLDVCDALDAAHRRGIVHCNLKPSNVIITCSRENNYSAHLLGFGTAKWSLGTEDPFEDKLVGNPLSMAPEQWRSRRLVTPATDVWSLGLLAFYLFTGRCYWLANEPIAVIQEVLRSSLVPASERARQFGCSAQFPVWFDDWFARCVVRDAEQRFATAGDAARAFRHCHGDTRSNALIPRTGAIDAFISYSPKDMSFCDDLLIHLSMMRRQRLVNEWHERLLLAGSVTDEEVRKWLARSEVFIALLSADFIDSDKCFVQELQAAMVRHRTQTGCLIPILVRPCDWSHPPFSDLSVLPRNGTPISSWSNRDQAWLDVVRDVRRVIELLHERAPRLVSCNEPAT